MVAGEERISTDVFEGEFYDRTGRGVRLNELAPNYRMSELQAAVGLAQLDRLPGLATRRRSLGNHLTARLLDKRLPGVSVHAGSGPAASSASEHSRAERRAVWREPSRAFRRGA